MNCIKCQRITAYGPQPFCGHYNKIIPGAGEFAARCKAYWPFPELRDEQIENLQALWKEPKNNG